MPFLGKTPAQIVDPEVDIDGGSIDGATIGATSASAATVTTFTSTGIDDNATSTAITIDASENVGIGEPSPAYLLDLKGGTNDSIRLNALSGGFIFANGSGVDKGSFSMNGGNMNIAADAGIDFYPSGSPLSGDPQVTLDSSGRVGIGKAPTCALNVASDDYVKVVVEDVSGTDTPFSIGSGVNALTIANNASGDSADEAIALRPNDQSIAFTTAGSEAMRIDSSGDVLVGKTSPSVASAGFEVHPSGGTYASGNSNTYHYYNTANSQYRFYVKSNGGIVNFSANNINLSDERTKKNIVASGDYLSKLCQIPVRNFRYNHEEDDGKHHLGVISQEVEAIAPELVQKNAYALDDETTRDAIYTTDLNFAMLKAIQEQQAIIDSQASAIADLTTRLEALEAN